MLILILTAFLVLVPQIAHSDCVDYADYMKWLGRVDTPRLEREVAISGTKAYVVTNDYSVDGTSSLQVIDLSNPTSPTILGSVIFPGEGWDVSVSGSWAYVANSNQGLRVIDVSNPASPSSVATLHTPGNNARGVAVCGTLAYVADCSAGIQIIDVSNPAAPTIIGYANTPACALDVAVSGTLAYVAANVAGLQIIDVSNPMSPSWLGRLDTPYSADKVAVTGTTALVVDDDLYIIDVSNPWSPALLQQVYASGGAYDVAVSAGVAYLATNWDGLVLLDITKTETPYASWLGNFELSGAAWAVAVSSRLAVVVMRSTSGPQQLSGLEVFDASNPEFAPVIGYLDHGQSVAVNGTRIYTTDRISTSACPYPNPPCQSRLSVFDRPNTSLSITLPLGIVNTPGHAFGIAAAGTTAYVADGEAGLEVVDVSNPSSPQIIGNANTPGEAVDVVVSGVMAYVADGPSGLQVINLSNPSAPVIVGAVATPYYASEIDVSGPLVCEVDASADLQVIDVSTPSRPRILGHVDTPGNATDVVMSGSLAFVTDNDAGAGFQVVSLSNPHSPAILATLDLPGTANGLALIGSNVYVADDTEALQVIDVSNPSAPVITGRRYESSPNKYFKIATSDQLACVIQSGYPLVLPLQCLTPPVVDNPGTQHGTELAYFSMTLTATDADQGGLTMVPVSSLPSWATFTDAGNGTASLSGVPQSGQAGTFPISIKVSDDRTSTTVSFSIVIAPAGQVGVDGGTSRRFRFEASPNPFRAGMELQFELVREAHVSVVILDLQGRKVRELVGDEFPTGTHRVTWEGRDDHRALLGPGLYFARLVTSDGHVQVQKLFKIS